MVARRRRRQSFVEQLLYVLVLIVVWIFLWDEVSGMVIISGAVLAFAVMRAFYLPPIQLSGRLNFYYGTYFLLLVHTQRPHRVLPGRMAHRASPSQWTQGPSSLSTSRPAQTSSSPWSPW